MRPVRLLIMTAFALLAFGAVGTAMASAEEGPLLLILEGKTSELVGKVKGASDSLS